MGLEEELAGFRAEFERTAPSGRAALYSAKIEELRGRFSLKDALAVGDEAPDFTLPDSRGTPDFACHRATGRPRSGDLLSR
jgi:hypothetical protein